MLVALLEVACQAWPSWLSVGLLVIELSVLWDLVVSELVEIEKSVLDQSFVWLPVDSAASL